MSLNFERPVGAAADARELEYVAALHQTDDDQDDSWMDGSIEATDVKNFLLSRYGITVTEEEVRELIFKEMGGGDSEDECIDLTEVVAILIIPYLAKIHFNDNVSTDDTFAHDNFQSQYEIDAYLRAQKIRNRMHEAKKIVSDVLSMILRNVTKSDNAKSRPLTRDLLRRIFKHYGEYDLLGDESFIDDMIAAAGGTELNAETFLNALTHDIELYDVTNESRFQTHYEDVFGLVTYEEGHKYKNKVNVVAKEGGRDKDVDSAENGQDSAKMFDLSTMGHSRHVERTFTFPQIDFLADSFRSRTQYIVMWITVTLTYFAWFQFVSDWGIDICRANEGEGNFGCQVGNSIVTWLALMSAMIFIVAPMVVLLSLGNNVYRHSILEIGASFAAIILLVIIPASVEFDLLIISTKQFENDETSLHSLFRTVLWILGAILLGMQLCNLIRFIVPDSRLTKSKALTGLLRGSAVRSEFGIKQAAIFKTHEMVKNAYNLHIIGTSNTSSRSSLDDEGQGELTEDPLLNFTKVSEKRESSGGFVWAWKMLFSGRMVEKEGIWLHTKLLAGNIVQLVVIILFSLFAIMLTQLVEKSVTEGFEGAANEIQDGSNSTTYSDSCSSLFNPSNCYFPESNGTSLGLGLCSGVVLPNTTCASNFEMIAGGTYDAFCDVFLDAADQLSPPLSYAFADGKCPSLYYPKEDLSSATYESVEELYCSGSLGVCTPPFNTGDSLHFEGCMLGSSKSRPFPAFQFYGDLCQNYTELEQLLETKEDAAEMVMDYMPSKRVWNVSLTVSILTTLLVGFSISLSTIPTMIVTTLKFRTGAIPSLRDPYFKKYRKGVLATTFLLGASFWGSFFSAAAVFFFTFVITFISVYPATQPFVLTFLSLLIGVTATLILKVILSFFLNNYGFTGFYRKRPLLANISSLCFECWHLALTSSYIIMRIVKLFIIIIIYIGRIDTPVLGQGVGEIGPIKLDAFPFIFKQDLLAIDAHRHPYIERLGMMYIMKLKHGDNFAKRTGSIWRLLFVFALFPWLRQYRILNEEDTVSLEVASKDTDLGKSAIFMEKIAELNAKVKRLTAMNKNLAKNR